MQRINHASKWPPASLFFGGGRMKCFRPENHQQEHDGWRRMYQEVGKKNGGRICGLSKIYLNYSQIRPPRFKPQNNP